jgi:hypothetical protein
MKEHKEETVVMYGINKHGKLIMSCNIVNGNNVEKEIIGLKKDFFQGVAFILNNIKK